MEEGPFCNGSNHTIQQEFDLHHNPNKLGHCILPNDYVLKYIN